MAKLNDFVSHVLSLGFECNIHYRHHRSELLECIAKKGSYVVCHAPISSITYGINSVLTNLENPYHRSINRCTGGRWRRSLMMEKTSTSQWCVKATQIAVVAARFSAAKADWLRWSLTTFKRMGTSWAFREKFISVSHTVHGQKSAGASEEAISEQRFSFTDGSPPLNVIPCKQN